MNQEGTHRLFVYGVLLDGEACRRLLGRPVGREGAHLDGYQRGRKGYFFVVASGGGCVEGAILSGLSDGELSLLDTFEEVPSLYTRESIEAIAAGGEKVRCWIYLPTGWERD